MRKRDDESAVGRWVRRLNGQATDASLKYAADRVQAVIDEGVVDAEFVEAGQRALAGFEVVRREAKTSLVVRR
jgi:hypothetical protein